MKVVRRLEMQQLEQQCWRYLLNIIDAGNCEQLHELADRYDCPPLKLAAWRILQQNVPGYSTVPSIDLESQRNAKGRGTGLTDPGMLPIFARDVHSDDDMYDDDEEYSVDDLHSQGSPSFLRRLPTITEDSESQDGSQSRSQSSYTSHTYTGTESSVQGHLRPSTLPHSAPASTVVRAWAARLQDVYRQCVPENIDEFEESDEMFGRSSNPRKAIARYERAIRRGRVRGPGRRGSSVGSGSVEMKQGDSEDGSVLENNASIDWRAELHRLYEGIGMAEKTKEIDNILRTWAGKEDKMLDSLLTKYRRRMSQELYEHLENLHSFAETQTESSFVRGPAAMSPFATGRHR